MKDNLQYDSSTPQNIETTKGSDNEIIKMKSEGLPSCFIIICVIPNKQEYIVQCRICDVLMYNVESQKHLETENHKSNNKQMNNFGQESTSSFQSTSSFDRDIKNILDSKIQDEGKWILYSKTLHKYSYLLEKPKAINIGKAIKKPNKKQSEKIVKIEDSKPNLCNQSNIMELVPDNKSNAMELLSYLTKCDFITWIENGTIFVDNKEVKKSNIVNLINDVISNKQTTDPLGWKKFSYVLHKIDFPIKYIENPVRREYISNLQQMQINRERMIQNKQLEARMKVLKLIENLDSSK